MLVEVKQEVATTHRSTVSTKTTISKQIHCLCTAFETPISSGIPDEPSYGSLISEDITYHIYDIPYQPNQHHTAITLQDIIDGDLFHTLERKQRFSLALTIASSFVQLLDSSWLPTTITKADIIFILDPNPSGGEDYFLDEDKPAFLNEPYVQRPFVSKKTGRSQETVPIADSLDQLGIILLELGFGKRLQDQSCWRRHNAKHPASNDHLRAVYDVLAARELQGKVLEKAGQDYAAAVDWCLGGNRSCGSKGQPEKKSGKPGNGTIERWRKDMLNKVVGPLKMSCDYLAGKRSED